MPQSQRDALVEAVLNIETLPDSKQMIGLLAKTA
jgi:hypothetical protein